MSKAPTVDIPQSTIRTMPEKVIAPLRWQDHVLMALTLVILTLVLVQLMVPILPTIYFDVDPRSESAEVPITVLGPTACAWMSVIAMGLCSLVMLVHHLSGRKIAWLSSILALAGMFVCWYHMGDGVESMHRSLMWTGAMSMALAARHLVEHDRLRRLVVASLIAMLIPLALQSLAFVLVEHPATVKMFHENEKQFLEARGWIPGSPQHILYVRRLMFDDATGAFGLSNVYGSVVAALTLLGIVITGHVARQWRATWAMLPGVAVLLGLVTVYLTHSKGAAAVLGAGLILCFAAWFISRCTERSRLTLPVLAVLMIGGASLAVIARGAILGTPKTAEGERSILFRYQYWQGATRVVTHMTTDKLLWGLGPGEFKQQYVVYKDPLNPEEVTSTHNVFLDQWLSLGLGGVCWSLLLLGWVCRGGQLAGEELTAVPDPHALLAPRAVRGETLAMVCALALMLFGFRALVQTVTLLTTESLLSFCFGAIGFIVLTSVLTSEGWLTRSATRTGLFVAGSVLLIHNQIEMTFFHEGACVVAMFIVACAGAGHLHVKVGKEDEPAEKPAVFRLVVPVVLLVLMGMSIARAAVPMTQYQGQLEQAAIQLRDYHDYLESIGYLEQANRTIPHSPRAWRWRVQLLAELVQGTLKSGQRSRAMVMFQHAEQVSEEALKQCPNDLMLMRQMANLQMYAAKWFDQPARKSLALSQWNNIVAYNPYGLADLLSRADLLWEMGRKSDAVQAYEKTIMVNNQSYLDPDKQLSDRQRKHCLERIGAGKAEM